jgi:DNA/RNA-binding domain of Phe-tRNA-synthetase-like protein
VSLRHVVPVGGWDADQFAGGDIILRESRAGDSFQELGATADSVPVEPGEICYSDDATLITRHFVWRQSEEAKVTAKTRSLFLVSELIPPADEDVASRVVSTFEEGLRAYFGVGCRSAVLTSGSTLWDWSNA